MIRSDLEIGGAVAFWSLAEWSDRARLEAEFSPLGLHSLVPDPRPAPACLRAALDEVFAGPRVLVRPLATRDGFVVVKEDRGPAANRYQTELTARGLQHHQVAVDRVIGRRAQRFVLNRSNASGERVGEENDWQQCAAQAIYRGAVQPLERRSVLRLVEPQELEHV